MWAGEGMRDGGGGRTRVTLSRIAVVENWGQGRDSTSHRQRRQETWKTETKS